MSRINLLPAEVRRERASARLARSITVAGMAFAALLAGLYLIRTWEVITLNGDLEELQAQRTRVEASLAEYADLASDQAALTYGHNVVRAALAGEVSWSEQLLELSSTIPSGFTLSSLAGTLSQDPASPVVGSLTWTAGSSGYEPTETWLVRLATQEGWANPWLTSLQGTGTGFTVNGSVDLTSDAITTRGGGPA